MEQHEARLFDLLESKDFSELTAEELVYVGEYLTEDEYRFQQQLIRAAQDWAPEVEIEPLPLKLPEAVGPLRRSIPLYQALLAVAAVIVLFVVLRPFRETVLAPVENVEPLTKIKTEIVHDTVVQYISKTDTVVLREKVPMRQEVVHVPVTANSERSDHRPAGGKGSNGVKPAEELILPGTDNTMELPELNEAAMRNEGQSMRKDETYQLIPAGRGW